MTYMNFTPMRSKVLTLLFTLSVIFGSSAFAARFKTVTKLIPFSEEEVCFRPDTFNNGVWHSEDGKLLRLGNGRIILKKIQLPKVKRDVKLTAKVTLTSNGDRWDKTGSCFIIPSNSKIDMIKVANGEAEYPTVKPEFTEKFKGVILDTDYYPTVEIMRFMTPFGVGHYSDNKDSIAIERRRPVYIDEWAPNVEWTQDISDLYSLLTDEVYVGVFVDTWTTEGYKVSVEIDMEESEVKQDKLIKQTVTPLVNTIYYQGQGIPDIFNRQDLLVNFNIPKNAKNVRLKYIVTGHGGLSGGDEFVPNENIISIDDEVIHRFTPWRTDCASFRRFNPSTGTWLIKREASYIAKNGAGLKEIEEILGSSDLSRSNWCPGSVVDPVVLPLTNCTAGNHQLRISIPKAQSAADGLNHWLVSAYLVWE